MADELYLYSEPPPNFRKKGGRVAAIIAIIGAVGGVLAAVVVPITSAYFNRPPRPQSNSVEVQKALIEENKRLDKEVRKLHEEVIELRSWLKGYVEAQGVRVQDPPDVKAPPGQNVTLTPQPKRPKRTVFSPAPEARPPLPVPRPVSRRTEIPTPIEPPPD